MLGSKRSITPHRQESFDHLHITNHLNPEESKILNFEKKWL